MRTSLEATFRQGFDDKVEVATELPALVRSTDIESPCRPSRCLWRYSDYTAFPISLCNELARFSILRDRERNAWNRSAVSGWRSDPS
jgi:hypothetical protein